MTAMLTLKQEQLRTLMEAGMTRGEVEEAMRMREAALLSLRRRLEQKTGREWHFPGERARQRHRKRAPLAEAGDHGVIQIGCIGPEARALDEDVQRWIIKNLPQGVTLAAFALSCLLDAYHDDKEAKP